MTLLVNRAEPFTLAAGRYSRHRAAMGNRVNQTLAPSLRDAALPYFIVYSTPNDNALVHDYIGDNKINRLIFLSAKTKGQARSPGNLAICFLP